MEWHWFFSGTTIESDTHQIITQIYRPKNVNHSLQNIIQCIARLSKCMFDIYSSMNMNVPCVQCTHHQQ